MYIYTYSYATEFLSNNCVIGSVYLGSIESVKVAESFVAEIKFR